MVSDSSCKALAMWALVGTCVLSCNRAEYNVRTKAASDFNCSEDHVETAELSDKESQAKFGAIPDGRTVQVLACGRKGMYVLMCPGGNRLDPSCSYVNMEALKTQMLVQRATFDLSCPAEQLKMTPLDMRTVGIEGCNVRLAYVWQCPHNPALVTRACGWMADLRSTVRPVPIPTPPMQPTR